jgi:GxxExxY protein
MLGNNIALFCKVKTSSKILYPELSYKIMGVLFTVHNQLGYGYMEKHYQRAIGQKFRELGINFNEQVRLEIEKNKRCGHYYADFIVEKQIVLEIKANPRITRDSYLQVKRYLRETRLELGILATFGRKELIYKRILRGYNW